MRKPATVVFDLGKVLVDFDYRIAARNLAAHGKRSADEIARFISESPLLLRYEEGLLTSSEFFAQMREATGFADDFDAFGLCFGDIFTPIEPMIQLHSELRGKGLPTYIFSNTNEFAVHHIRRSFPFFSNFNGHILSYEHGAMKPDPKLYLVVEQTTGKSGGDILYLDDRPENIETGAQRGWQVILQETPERSRQAIQALGLL
jgi:2-haloacid dehalogenase